MDLVVNQAEPHRGAKDMLSLLKRLFGGGRTPRGQARHVTTRVQIGGSNPTFRKTKPPATDALDTPDLSIEAPQETGFDPYNTGTFNRSGSWERINKRRNG